MQRGEPSIRQQRQGERLFRQGEEGTSVVVVLDGVFEVRVDGKVVGEVGPGTVVGERAHLETGVRTAELRATTDARIAEVDAATLDPDMLEALAEGHHREDTT
jgi:CRP-like cAMP-binding protein